jgi:hypothetical protein
MAAFIRGAKYAQDASDITLCSWGDEPGDCVFLQDPVPITDIKAVQIRVHSVITQDAITTCEGDKSDVPFFSLKLTEFGYPEYNGVFPCCKNAADVVKTLVGKLPLVNHENVVVDATSAAAVDALHDALCVKSPQVTKTVEYWSRAWHKDKLVEQRSPEDNINHKILITKCLGAGTDFRNFYKVRYI